MSTEAEDMMVAYQDWEDNKGGDNAHFWAIFEAKRETWRASEAYEVECGNE